MLALHGTAENGRLVGGAIENLSSNDDLEAVDDAVAGPRWLDPPDTAALVSSARDEHPRFRPTGCEELSADDASLWEQLDSASLDVATSARAEEAVRFRLQEVAPELMAP